ncbi:MAG: NUDIX domain-containing protein [Anaerolineae bacterium]|jgi:ADP-ribose pyrophosphatase YjhB (NUDIX family)|nr:NUDIX domain-containing protein [Anaerolineae bacterium]
MRYVPDQEGKIWDVGAAGAVVHEGRVLLVRKTYGVAKGMWGLPGGFAQHDELLDEAALREVWEETGVHAEVLALIAVRSRYEAEGGAVFVIFRMRPLDGDLHPDGTEVDDVRYFSVEEIQSMGEREIFPLTRSTALTALSPAPGLEVADLPPSSSGFVYRAFLARES